MGKTTQRSSVWSRRPILWLESLECRQVLSGFGPLLTPHSPPTDLLELVGAVRDVPAAVNISVTSTTAVDSPETLLPVRRQSLHYQLPSVCPYPSWSPLALLRVAHAEAGRQRHGRFSSDARLVCESHWPRPQRQSDCRHHARRGFWHRGLPSE